MIPQNILVTGAAGFIGKVVVTRLLETGWRVKAMVRNISSLPFPKHENLTITLADMRNNESLIEALIDVTTVIHLAAAKSDEKDSEDVNVEGAKRLISACENTGCSRLINISTQSVKIQQKGTYARTKNEADLVFHNSDLKITSLLPSVVYGEEKSGVFGTILTFVEKLPIIPVLGDGKWVCAPVYVGDLYEAIISCIENDATIGKIYDIGGPNQISFNELIDKLATALGIKRPKLHIPFSVSLLAAKIVTTILPNPPITISNVLGSNQNTNIDISPAQQDFGFDPMHLDDGIKLVLQTKDSSPDTDSLKKKESLAAEARLFCKYLISHEPPQELVNRYISANCTLLDNKSEPELRFIHRHPNTLPLIEAAAGLLKPQSILRQKLLIMAAILEATPLHAEFFLQTPGTPVKLLIGLGWQSIRSIVKITAGIPLFFIASRE